MANTVKKVLQEAFDKLIKPKKEQAAPQLVLQPVRSKNIWGVQSSLIFSYT